MKLIVIIIFYCLTLFGSFSIHAMHRVAVVRKPLRPMSAAFCTTIKNNVFCQLIPKKGLSLKESIDIAKQKIIQNIHDDPEIGTSWRSCQTTAVASLIDSQSEPSFSILARYLLNVDSNGFSPKSNLINERLRTVGLVCSDTENDPSNRKIQNSIIPGLQSYLRQDIADKLGLDLISNDKNELIYVDSKEAFKKAFEILLIHKPLILLAIIPGTPSLSEVRSFVGAEFIVPYRFKDGAYKLDEGEEFFRISANARQILTQRGGLSIRGGYHIVQRIDKKSQRETFRIAFGPQPDNYSDLKIIKEIPKVRIPKDGENVFVLHIGFPVQNFREIEHNLGNIISALELESLDPIEFARARYEMMQEKSKDLSQEELDSLPHSHLSLYHFSHIMNFNNNHFDKRNIEFPNSILIRNGKMAFQSKYKHHYPFLLHDNVIDPYESHGGLGLTIEKAEQGLRFFFRVAKNDKGEFDLEHSYIRLENVDGTVINKNLKESADKFIGHLLTNIRAGFCPRTRNILLGAGLSEEVLENIKKYHVEKLIAQFKPGIPLREYCKEYANINVSKDAPDYTHPLIKGTSVIFGDNHAWYLLRIVKSDTNKIDVAHSYIKTERCIKNGRSRLVNDERVAHIYALRFLEALRMHLEEDFRPDKKLALNDAGIDKELLDEIEARLPELLYAENMRGEPSIEPLNQQPPAFILNVPDPLGIHEGLGSYFVRGLNDNCHLFRVAHVDEKSIDLSRSYLLVGRASEKGLLMIEHEDAIKVGTIFIDWLLSLYQQNLGRIATQELENMGLFPETLMLIKEKYLEQLIISRDLLKDN